jgi:hypothetical protein
MAHATLSTSIEESVATRLRSLARREDRSTSSLIANAVALYIAMPRELREALRTLAAEDAEFLHGVLNEMTALALERKFDLARRELAKSTKAVPELKDATEADIADMAVAIATKP